MNIPEFSDQFNVLYNNVTSNQAPGLDEYEKSVFLTKSQDEVLKAYFDPRGNKFQEGFDGSEKRQIDFSMLMRTINITEITPITGVSLYPGMNVKHYRMPNDIFLYINETVSIGTGKNLVVVPISYTEYNRLMSKPFKRPLKNQAWRLINSGAGFQYVYTDYVSIANLLAAVIVEPEVELANADTFYSRINRQVITFEEAVGTDFFIKVNGKCITFAGDIIDNYIGAMYMTTVEKNDIQAFINTQTAATDTIIELIPGPNDAITSYIVRYVARPKPIILEDLSGSNVSLGGGFTEPMGCQLDPIIHEEILQRAVELAKAAYIGDLTSQVSLGQVSGTNMGVVANNR